VTTTLYDQSAVGRSFKKDPVIGHREIADIAVIARDLAMGKDSTNV